MASKGVIDALLDEAFRVLQHDTGPHDPEYVYQRNELRKRFTGVLKTRPTLDTATIGKDAREWGDRHDLRINGTDLTCAFEDAATLYR